MAGQAQTDAVLAPASCGDPVNPQFLCDLPLLQTLRGHQVDVSALTPIAPMLNMESTRRNNLASSA
jgi:hypothetical protein